MSNPFELLAEQQINSPTRAKLRAAEKRAAKQTMVPTDQEKKLIDQSRQLRSYRRWKRERIKQHLAIPYRPGFLALRRVLRSLTIETPDALLDFVAGASWLHAAPFETRAIVLDVISARISRLRIQNGLEPFDDSLPGEEPTAFEIIRAQINTFTKSAEQT